MQCSIEEEGREVKIKCKVIFTSCLFNCGIGKRPMPFVYGLLSAGRRKVLFDDALLLLFTRDDGAGRRFTDDFCDDDCCCCCCC